MPEIDELAEMLDDDGYPNESALKRIREWSHNDWSGLIDFVRFLWRYDFWDRGDDGSYFISTGGWSGNESIIEALEQNRAFWALCWQSSRRGGHYEFKLYKFAATHPEQEDGSEKI